MSDPPIQQGGLSPEDEDLAQAVALLQQRGFSDDRIKQFISDEKAKRGEWSSGHGSSGSWGDGPDRVGDVSTQIVKGATMGLSTKPMAAANAAVSGQPFKKKYEQEKMVQRARELAYENYHPVASTALQIGGGLLSSLATAPAAAAGKSVPFLSRLAANAEFGGLASGASAFVNEDGSFGDRVDAAADAAPIGALFAAGLTTGGKLLSPLARPVGDAAAKGLRAVGMNRAADIVGPTARAGKRITDVMEQDKGAPLAEHRDIPRLNLDRLRGTEGEGLVKGLLRKPGEARSTLAEALKQRMEEIRPAVSNAFDRLTGTTREGGERLVQQLQQGQERVAAGTEAADAANRARAALARERPEEPNALNAFREVAGGQPAEGLQYGERLRNARQQEADVNFGTARAEENAPMWNDDIAELVKTPTGGDSFRYAIRQKLDRLRAIPKQAAGAPTIAGGYDEAKLGSLEKMLAALEARGLPTPELEQEMMNVVDPEMLHYMTQYLRRAARVENYGGQRVGSQLPEGTQAVGANAAMGLLQRAQQQLPERWQQIIGRYREQSVPIDAFAMGRDLMRARLNPSGEKAARFKSLEAFERRVARMPREAQDAFREGGRFAIETHLRETGGGNRARMIQQLSDPASEMSRRVGLATGRPEAAGEFAQRLTPAERVLPPETPTPRLTPAEEATGTGLDIFKYKTAPTSAAPELSLGNLRNMRQNMAPDALSNFRQATAHAVRGDLAAAPEKPAAIDRVFDRSPERREQVGHAFERPEAQADFEGLIDAAEEARGRTQRVMGGSDTQANIAQAQEEGDLLSKVVAMGKTGSKLANTLLDRMTVGNRKRVNNELARILSSRDPALMTNAQKAAALRAYMYQVTTGQAGAVEGRKHSR